MREKFIVLVVAVFLTFINSTLAYRPVIDLDPFDEEGSYAYSINDNGQIVGEYFGFSACLFDSTGHGANKYLGFFNSSYSDWSSARSINNNGQIVGWAISANGSGHIKACLFDTANAKNNKDLRSLGGVSSIATSINNNGKIVGMADNSDSDHACLFDPTGNGANKDLGTLGGRNSFAYSINDNDKIVGQADTGSTSRACLFDVTGNGNNINLGTLAGWEYSSASFISNTNQIVGRVYYIVQNPGYVEEICPRACLFDTTGNGANIDLGTLGGNYSSASAINNYGQIVGYADDISGHPRACLFDPTGSGNNIDLNTLIDPSYKWNLIRATCINNNGWIIAYGYDSQGVDKAVLITPEPATLLLLGLGAVILRRKR